MNIIDEMVLVWALQRLWFIVLEINIISFYTRLRQIVVCSVVKKDGMSHLVYVYRKEHIIFIHA